MGTLSHSDVKGHNISFNEATVRLVSFAMSGRRPCPIHVKILPNLWGLMGDVLIKGGLFIYKK